MPHALIVDDSAATLSALVELVSAEGFTTSAALTVDRAKVELSRQSPDIVLDDLNLQDGTGMHLLDASVPLAPIPKRRVAIAVAPEVLQRYVGEYEVTPAFSIVVTLEGDNIFAQATGQPKFPIFAESDSQFFLRAVDAQITFTRDARGAITGLVLYQGLAEIPGRRK